MSNYFNTDFSPSKDTFKMIDDGLYRSNRTGDKLFLVQDGLKYWITSPEVLSELGYSFGQEKYLDNLHLIQSGEPIRKENLDKFRAPTSLVAEVGAQEAPSNTSPMTVDNVKEVEEGVIITEAHEDPSKQLHVIEEGLTSIIIPAFFNSYQMLHLTGDCIGQIREHTDKDKTPYEIILVINGDGIIKLDPKDTHADKVIQNKENMGYAHAVNQGIRVSRGEFISIVNNDVKVYKHWLEDLLEGLRYKDLVTATPMYSRTDPFMRGVESAQLREAQLSLPIEQSLSDFHDFSCVVMKRSVLDTIGLFDETFFYSCEDIDFVKRMEKAGLTHASSKRVPTHHISSATDLPNKGKVLDESKEKFKQKWG